MKARIAGHATRWLLGSGVGVCRLFHEAEA